jgi:hypothetical protein
MSGGNGSLWSAGFQCASHWRFRDPGHGFLRSASANPKFQRTEYCLLDWGMTLFNWVLDQRWALSSYQAGGQVSFRNWLSFMLSFGFVVRRPSLGSGRDRFQSVELGQVLEELIQDYYGGDLEVPSLQYGWFRSWVDPFFFFFFGLF